MKKFTYSGNLLKIAHPETGDLIVMHEGDSLTLPDEFVDGMCEKGWGTADGVTTGERKPGAVAMGVANTKVTPKVQN